MEESSRRFNPKPGRKATRIKQSRKRSCWKRRGGNDQHEIRSVGAPSLFLSSSRYHLSSKGETIQSLFQKSKYRSFHPVESNQPTPASVVFYLSKERGVIDFQSQIT